MASYAPSSITPQNQRAIQDERALQQPVDGDFEESAKLLPGLSKVPHIRALIALVLFFPTGIFALIFSLLARRESEEAAGKAEDRAEKYTIISYRIGVVIIFTLALLLLAAIVIIIVNGIKAAHVGASF